MNKILFTILVLAFSLPAFAGSYLDKQLKEAQKNVKYNTVKTQTAIYQVLPVNTYFEGELKDPKLIKLTDVDIVDEKDYLAKLKSDNEIYNSKIKPVIDKKIDLVDSDAPVSLDFYNVYRIAEKLIRANNLQYANWRIAIRKTPEEINAYASSANLITLHTSIYDSSAGESLPVLHLLREWYQTIHLLLWMLLKLVFGDLSYREYCFPAGRVEPLPSV